MKKYKIKTGKLGQIGVGKPIGKEWVKKIDKVRKDKKAGLIGLLLGCGLLLGAQNTVIVGGDATYAMNEVVLSDLTHGNPCGNEYFCDLFVNGDYTLKGDIVIQYGRLTIYGNLIYNGYEVLYTCAESELIVTGETLSVIPEDTSITAVQLYPNPTSGIFYLTTKKPYKVTIYDGAGRIVAEGPDLRGLPQGVYYAYIQIENISFTEKIIKN